MKTEMLPRIWVNYYRNNLNNDKYVYHAHETEKGSFEFRRLANYSGTQQFISLQEHDAILEERNKTLDTAMNNLLPLQMEFVKQKALLETERARIALAKTALQKSAMMLRGSVRFAELNRSDDQSRYMTDLRDAQESVRQVLAELDKK